MLTQIEGLHHVSAMASSARANNAFFTGKLGLRRVKKTVNFDAPDIYHLYYGDESGTPGTVMTYFPFPHAARGTSGTGEADVTAFAVPPGSLGAWSSRLADAGARRAAAFGEDRLEFRGPDGERLALAERSDDRRPWTGGGVGADMAIRGFHSVTLSLAETGPTAELLELIGYRKTGVEGDVSRFELPEGPARFVDLRTDREAGPARQGAGSVHHVAFAVPDRDRQLEVRQALTDAGFRVTPPIDRDYFWAIYFRTPGGVLFEIATDGPGFDRDEDREHLGEALKLPTQHEHLRERLERQLEPIE